MLIDLHSHSRASDGTHTPTELVALAQNSGIQTFAITDHDTMAGYLSLVQTANHDGYIYLDTMQVIAGVEISCHHKLMGGYGKHASRDKIIHIVGLAIKDTDTMQNALQKLQDERANRGRLMADKLVQLFDKRVADSQVLDGQVLDGQVLGNQVGDLWQRILTKADNNPKAVGRSHIAQVLYELGYVKSVQEAFDKYLADNKPAYVPLQAWDMAAAIGQIHACGGVAVLAHPTRYHLSATQVRRLIGDFAAVGGDAIELPACHEPPSLRQMIDRAAMGHKLLVSVGSDFHGEQMPWRKLGVVPSLNARQIGVWTKF